jgi:FeS assembly SUF system protein
MQLKIPNWFQKEKGPPVEAELLHAQIIERLRTILDPEIPVNIYDLGLIYDLHIDTKGDVQIKMTLTAPGCPVAQTFPGRVAECVRDVEGVSECAVELVWDPPWNKSLLSEAAKVQLGMY